MDAGGRKRPRSSDDSLNEQESARLNRLMQVVAAEPSSRPAWEAALRAAGLSDAEAESAAAAAVAPYYAEYHTPNSDAPGSSPGSAALASPLDADNDAAAATLASMHAAGIADAAIDTDAIDPPLPVLLRPTVTGAGNMRGKGRGGNVLNVAAVRPPPAGQVPTSQVAHAAVATAAGTGSSVPGASAAAPAAHASSGGSGPKQPRPNGPRAPTTLGRPWTEEEKRVLLDNGGALVGTVNPTTGRTYTMAQIFITLAQLPQLSHRTAKSLKHKWLEFKREAQAAAAAAAGLVISNYQFGEDDDGDEEGGGGPSHAAMLAAMSVQRPHSTVLLPGTVLARQCFPMMMTSSAAHLPLGSTRMMLQSGSIPRPHMGMARHMYPGSSGRPFPPGSRPMLAGGMGGRPMLPGARPMLGRPMQHSAVGSRPFPVGVRPVPMPTTAVHHGGATAPVLPGSTAAMRPASSGALPGSAATGVPVSTVAVRPLTTGMPPGSTLPARPLTNGVRPVGVAGPRPLPLPGLARPPTTQASAGRLPPQQQPPAAAAADVSSTAAKTVLAHKDAADKTG